VVDGVEASAGIGEGTAEGFRAQLERLSPEKLEQFPGGYERMFFTADSRQEGETAPFNMGMLEKTRR
jgi:hypothetical protein